MEWKFKYSYGILEKFNFKKTCNRKCPPGSIVYSNDDVRIYQVDGKKEKVLLKEKILLKVVLSVIMFIVKTISRS